jgi:hypothetical protein
MATQTDLPSISILAGEALEAYRIAQRDGTYADALSRNAIGITQEKVASADDVAVRMPAAGTSKVTAAAAVLIGAIVVSADDGKVQPIPATPGVYIQRGIAMQAASGNGSIFEIAPIGWGQIINLANQAASAAVTATTTPTSFDKSFTFPANSLKAGDRIRFRAQVIASATNSTDTLTLKALLGSDELAATAAVDVANGDIGYIEGEIVVRTAGASGTAVAAGSQALGVPGTVTAKPFLKASFTLDTTATKELAIQATWSTNNAGNSCRLDVLDVELLPAGAG